MRRFDPVQPFSFGITSTCRAHVVPQPAVTLLLPPHCTQKEKGNLRVTFLHSSHKRQKHTQENRRRRTRRNDFFRLVFFLFFFLSGICRGKMADRSLLLFGLVKNHHPYPLLLGRKIYCTFGRDFFFFFFKSFPPLFRPSNEFHSFFSFFFFFCPHLKKKKISNEIELFTVFEQKYVMLHRTRQ